MRNRDLQLFIINLVNQDSPYGITRRGIFYKVVSAGFYPGTERKHYNKLGSVLGKLRGEDKLNEDNILDSTRIRRIPYIFNSPADFLADVENQYAKTYGRISRFIWKFSARKMRCLLCWKQSPTNIVSITT